MTDDAGRGWLAAALAAVALLAPAGCGGHEEAPSLNVVLIAVDTLRWDHVGKQYTSGVPLQDGQARRDGLGDLLAGWGKVAYDNLRNGKLRYRPDLSRELARQGSVDAKNVIWDAAGGQIPASATASRQHPQPVSAA